MVEESIISDIFGNNPFSRVLGFLLDKRPFEFAKEELIKETGISRNTLFKIFPKFEELGIIIFTRKIGNTNMYVWNDESKISQSILAIMLEAGNRFLEHVVKSESKSGHEMAVYA